MPTKIEWTQETWNPVTGCTPISEGSVVGCAIGAALPETVQKFEQGKAEERRQKAEDRRKRAEERRQAAEAEAKRRETERQQMEAQRRQMETQGQIVASLGQAVGTLRYFAGNPMATQAQAAASLGVSRRTVGTHLASAEKLGAIKRNGHGVEVLIDLD